MVVGCASNPVTGRKQLMLMSSDEELQVGKEYAPEVEKQLGGRLDNPAIQAYVSSVGQKIVKVSHNPELEFHFAAVNDDSLNAMALPGGYVFITKGMLSKLKNEAQLAAVLSHETVHVTARHSANAMSKQIGIEILLSAISGEKTPAAAVKVAELAGQMLQLRYSRGAEYEADTFGLDYMTAAGYDPQAMYEMMQMLDKESTQRPIEFLSTHPNPGNRMENIQERIRSTAPGSNLRTGEQEYKGNVLSKL
jgi:predicted Zn-dependent protease